MRLHHPPSPEISLNSCAAVRYVVGILSQRMLLKYAVLLGGACAVACWCAPAAVAADRPTFRSDTRTVALPSTVTDAEHRIVPDLTQDDFEVLEDERAQPITYFATERQPIRVVVLLDTSASMMGTIPLIRSAAGAFVDRLHDDDSCRVGSFNDTVQFGRPFTSDRDALAQDIGSLEWGDATRLYDALAAGLDTLATGNGRRVILVLTDGEDTESDTRLQTVVTRARAEGVMVYAVGLERTRIVGRRTIASTPDRGLKTLARETGGGYVALSSATDLAAAFGRIADELHSQYVIGFEPQRLDGRVHALSVRVKRPGLTTRSRRSYVAVPDAAVVAAPQ
jgi:Ca-activated chloride channel homolog